jgi:hypothetical protein
MPRCRATTKNGPRAGEQCGQHVKVGDLVCRYHGGATAKAKAAAARRRAILELQREFDKLGTPLPEANALDVLRDLVREWAGNVCFWRAQVQALQEACVDTSTDPVFPFRSSTIYAKYTEACDRLAHYSKLAMEAGLDEAEIRLVNNEAEVIAEVLRNFATSMGVLHDPRAGPAMRAALTLLPGREN